jgi:hypothetical protein
MVFNVPNSNRQGYSQTCVSSALLTPVPPERHGQMSTCSATYMPPVPVGPYSDLWPVKQTTSMFMAAMSISTTPAVWAASIANNTPRSRQIAPTSATRCTVPITLEPWFMTTSLVSGRIRDAMSAGST